MRNSEELIISRLVHSSAPRPVVRVHGRRAAREGGAWHPSTRNRRTGGPPLECSLLNLMIAVQDVAGDEAEVIATIVHLVNSGRVRLCGSFAGATIDCSSGPGIATGRSLELRAKSKEPGARKHGANGKAP